jgi:radical SAM superfamily enzyme with C-terminal helix-hairpin-helix motif
VLTCGECSTELREATFDVDVDIDAFATEHRGEGCELTVDTVSIEATSRMQTVDARGRKVSARYAKTFYGFLAEFEVSCGCGASETFSVDDDVQASFMEELV